MVLLCPPHLAESGGSSPERRATRKKLSETFMGEELQTQDPGQSNIDANGLIWEIYVRVKWVESVNAFLLSQLKLVGPSLEYVNILTLKQIIPQSYSKQSYFILIFLWLSCVLSHSPRNCLIWFVLKYVRSLGVAYAC